MTFGSKHSTTKWSTMKKKKIQIQDTNNIPSTHSIRKIKKNKKDSKQRNTSKDPQNQNNIKSKMTKFDPSIIIIVLIY